MLVKLSRIAPLRAMSADTRYPSTCRSPGAIPEDFISRDAPRDEQRARDHRDDECPFRCACTTLRLIFLPLVAEGIFRPP